MKLFCLLFSMLAVCALGVSAAPHASAHKPKKITKEAEYAPGVVLVEIKAGISDDNVVQMLVKKKLKIETVTDPRTKTASINTAKQTLYKDLRRLKVTVPRGREKSLLGWFLKQPQVVTGQLDYVIHLRKDPS